MDLPPLPTTQVSQFAPPSSLSPLSTSSSSLASLNPSSSIFTACQDLLAAHAAAVAAAAAENAAATAAATPAGASGPSNTTDEPSTSQDPSQPAPPSPAQPKPIIPGSALLTPDSLTSFEQRYECLATQGIWDLDPVPRPLPWFKLRKGWSGWECDAAWSRQASETGNLAFSAADAVADEARHAKEWQVRDAVKYRWRAHRRCGRWGAVDREVLAGRLAGRKESPAHAGRWRRRRGGGGGAGGGAGGAGGVGGGGGEGGAAGSGKGGSGGYEGLEHLIVVRDEVPDFCARLDLRQQQDFPVCTQITFGVQIPRVPADSASILFVRDDILRTSPANPDPAAQDPSAGPADAPALSLPWFDQVNSNISVLILNRGTHFVEDERFIPQLNETLTKVRAAAPDLLIIYRSTPPGHAHCDQLLAPITERQDASSLPNHWGELAAQNEWARRLVKG
ncbi:hypothetical protein CLOP_g1018 [Closterium sp. NIES-67]|nr:hypothetical protein CLOP_g1018 [Closterium sp. NIES-67]